MSQVASTAHRPVARIATLLLAVWLGGCASQGKQFDDIPPEIARIPDAVPRVEPLSKFGNPESYVVLGQRYGTLPSSRGYVEHGLASWYGRDFQGHKTSSGEIYDIYAMSAAHKTLPLPTYARITNLNNRRSIVIRINDRGPFHEDRLIDLSYAAAVKLGVVKTGTALVEVRAIDPRHPESDSEPFLAAQTTKTQATADATEHLENRRTAMTSPPKSVNVQVTPRPAPELTVESTTKLVSEPIPSRLDTPVTTADDRRSLAGEAIYLQLGAFGDPQNAERLRAELATRLRSGRVRILTPEATGTALYKVRVGPLASEQDVAQLTEQLAALGLERPQRVSD